MIFLNLTEIDAGIAKADIGKIELIWGVNIPSALYVIADCTAYYESIAKEVKILFNGVDVYRFLFFLI